MGTWSGTINSAEFVAGYTLQLTGIGANDAQCVPADQVFDELPDGGRDHARRRRPRHRRPDRQHREDGAWRVEQLRTPVQPKPWH